MNTYTLYAIHIHVRHMCTNRDITHIIKRYQNLSHRDRERLQQAAINAQQIDHTKDVYLNFQPREVSEDTHQTPAVAPVLRKRFKRQVPSYLRRYPIRGTRGVVKFHDVNESIPAIAEDAFSEAAETETLAEDRFKAEIYELMTKQIKNDKYQIDEKSDRFGDTALKAMREDLLNVNRPVLTNELADYSNPYMMKRQILEKILHSQCVRNRNDERLVRHVLDKRADLQKLRSQAEMPPEVIEPLFAFHGITRYSYNHFENLDNKLESIKIAVEEIKQSESKDSDEFVRTVVDKLPENQPSDEISQFHPFANHFGFESAVPYGKAAGLERGRPLNRLDSELRKVRYPTLQRVAHSLPVDPKYRKSVVHAIRVLERSKGWDYHDKLHAINTMKEVFDNLASSRKYDHWLDKALPPIRAAKSTPFTHAKDKLHRGPMKWLRSLTTQKPLWIRQQKK